MFDVDGVKYSRKCILGDIHNTLNKKKVDGKIFFEKLCYMFSAERTQGVLRLHIDLEFFSIKACKGKMNNLNIQCFIYIAGYVLYQSKTESFDPWGMGPLPRGHDSLYSFIQPLLMYA